MNEVFLDSAYAIALSSSTDQHHEKAVKIAKELEEEGKQMVTTHAIVLEYMNKLTRLLRFYEISTQLV